MPAPRRVSVMFSAVMSGVITPTRSLGPTTLSRNAAIGSDDRADPPRPTCQLSTKITNTRAAGSCAASRCSCVEFGFGDDTVSVLAPGPRARTSSKPSTFCGLSSSNTSKSSAVRSVTAAPLALT